MEIDSYLDAALRNYGLPSDRALARAINRSHATVNAYRSKRQWPDDEAMLAIARLAEVAPDKALVDLNIWRAKSDTVRRYYLALAAKLTLSAWLALFSVIAPGTILEQFSVTRHANIHYAPRQSPSLEPFQAFPASRAGELFVKTFVLWGCL